jgi:hypothetical protein
MVIYMLNLNFGCSAPTGWSKFCCEPHPVVSQSLVRERLSSHQNNESRVYETSKPVDIIGHLFGMLSESVLVDFLEDLSVDEVTRQKSIVRDRNKMLVSGGIIHFPYHNQGFISVFQGIHAVQDSGGAVPLHEAYSLAMRSTRLAAIAEDYFRPP